MKIFVALTLCALLTGSHAFLGELADLFHNVGSELASVGKDLLKVAEPVANSLLATLEKAGTQLLTTAASDLLSHLGTGGGGKRDLSEIIDKVEQFVQHGKALIKDKADTLDAAFKATVAQIQSEIQQVVADAKPVAGLVQEVESIIFGHNNFVDTLISKAKEEAMTLFGDALHLTKRAEGAHTFAETLEQLLAQFVTPLKAALGGVVSQLTSQVSSLLG